MRTTKRWRDFGLDLVRALAGLLTLSVHFFLNSQFYSTPVQGTGMLLSCVIRTLCMTCVPLFLLLTGYTCVKRQWSRGYYRKLLPILLTYVLAGAICLAFQMLWLGDRWPLRTVALMFSSYAAAPYGWYIEMYIGLFLLSPFLNAAWHALAQDGKRALLLTLIGLTALPTIDKVGRLLPAWWMGIYPLTYYVVGAWLRENPIRIKGWKLMLCWLGLAAAVGTKDYLTARGGFFQIPPVEWGSLTLLIQAVLLFSCLRQYNGEGTPLPIRRLVGQVARLALPMYLISYIPDRLVYPLLNQDVPASEQIWWMPAVVLVVAVGSLAIAWLVDCGVTALMGLLPMKKQDAAHAQCRDIKES